MRKVQIFPIISLIMTALVLLGASTILRPLREERQRAAEEQWLSVLLPGGAPFRAEGGDGGAVRQLWRGMTGAVVEMMYDGYVCPIRVWVAVEKDGTVAGILIRESHETPGLGEKVGNDAAFLGQFLGKSEHRVNENDMRPLTGATVTSRTVAACVEGAVAAAAGVDVPTEATP